MLDRRTGRGRITLGADKAYDVRQFVEDLREPSITPHIAIDGHLSKTGKPRAMAMDRRTTRLVARIGDAGGKPSREAKPSFRLRQQQHPNVRGQPAAIKRRVHFLAANRWE